ncbi:hypothetical protein AB6A40_006385 [Gnathostoma spinigerum]|uniref:Uncharacterized protein n=1 Tax=Gnathostoma spinigerum TaxID=75299 RepID=A0ABD6EQH0_9BILA
MDEHVEALRMVIDLAEKKSVSKRGHVIAELNRPLNTIVEEEVVTGSFPPTVESTAVPGDDSEAPADPAASG